ncbi:diaminopimelate epimerase [Ihubacter sp. rT4E-8]|uniref:diaminopimelate epimerase n=1 Tax=Ihubacter sp. rT4E-8 TaxID=3242369 RepID=UPI003CF0135B
MNFTKMHGAGNDFIIINNMEEGLSSEQLSYLAKSLCRRRFSVGADGLMAVDFPEQGGDYRMRFFNADGSVGEMCGNGARCIARYGFEKGLAGDRQRIETTAGMVIGKRQSARMYTVRLNEISKIALKQEITVSGRTYTYSYVELGDPGIPHAVLRYEGLCALFDEGEDIEDKILSGRMHDDPLLGRLYELGQKLRYDSTFTKGANVNFYDKAGDNRLVELTYERGVEDFTLACGTGTGSVVATLMESDESDGKDVRVIVPGGELRIDIQCVNDKKEIYLTGPTDIVAEGIVTDEDLDI